MSNYYSTMSLKELLNEYFYTRLDYYKFTKEFPDDAPTYLEEIPSILIQNYQEIETEIERRMEIE